MGAPEPVLYWVLHVWGPGESSRQITPHPPSHERSPAIALVRLAFKIQARINAFCAEMVRCRKSKLLPDSLELNQG